ncbi:MAG: pyridoxamine 5'-phosphate oxidase [Maricaulaceae bacterium]
MARKVIPATPDQDDYEAKKDEYQARSGEHGMFTADDPIQLFETWLEEAGESEINDSNSMTLATVDNFGMPDARMVLLKDVDAKGFVFYTNANSAKGEQLISGKKAALCFHWKSLRRQVRVRGPVAVVGKAESDAYFASRARGSQIGAWASEQSKPVFDRFELEDAVEAVETRFKGRDVIRPPHWYGWRVKPISVEFWADGAYRLHDRRRFYRARTGARWQSERLSP